MIRLVQKSSTIPIYPIYQTQSSFTNFWTTQSYNYTSLSFNKKKNISTNMPVSEADKLFLCCRKFLVATRAKEFLYQIMITSIIGHVSLCTKFLKYLNDLFLEQKFLISCWSWFVMLNHSSTPWYGHLFWKDSIPKMH